MDNKLKRINIYQKYRKEIQKELQVDSLTIDVLQDEFMRISSNGMLAKYTFIFYILHSILSYFLYYLFGVKKKVIFGNDDFVFISCPDTVFRTKTINLIAHDLKYQIIYLPTFHLWSALKYSHYFKKKGICAIFPTFSINDIISAKKKLDKILRVIDTEIYKEEIASFRFQMATYLIYSNFTKRCFGPVLSFKGKWLLEHQKFFFIPLIAMLRNEKIETIMLQHGCFFKPSFNYLPLYTDKVLTCCEREKQLYIKNGVNRDRIIVFGAPLQTLTRKVMLDEKEYDLLLIMTSFAVNGNLQIEILNYLKNRFPQLRVLVRMRPRSRTDDLKNLKDYIKSFGVSEPGTPIDVDLSKTNKVICFSEDATFEVLNARKSFLLVGSEESSEKEFLTKCTTKSNYKEHIKHLLEVTYYSPFSKEEEIEMMGERDVSILHDKFVKLIKSS